MSYNVTAVTDTRAWESKYGKMISYVCTMEGPDGKANIGVEVAQKETTKPITVGTMLNGQIDWDGKFGPKFKKEQPQGGGGGGGGPRPRDPGERNSIERQVALKSAIELVASFESPHIENLDSEYTKSLLTEFFNHNLSLITGQEPPAATTQERAPEQPTPVASNGGKSPVDHAMDELRARYVKWSGDDPEAPAAWQNKLASMGLETPADASDEQLEELLGFLS